MTGKIDIKKTAIIIAISVMIILLFFICIKFKGRRLPEHGESSDSMQIFKSVLLGDTQFFYTSAGAIEAMTITDVPSIFDADDSYMKIWNFTVIDLDNDGEKEIVLFAVGVSGDMGGNLILHLADDKVYGYRTNNRTLVDLKADGTYSFSDPTGVNEVGIAAITAFHTDGYDEDKISYAAGTYEGFNTYVVNRQTATEEEYWDAAATQANKADAEWQDFTIENIEGLSLQ